jgi:hypothetical protein
MTDFDPEVHRSELIADIARQGLGGLVSPDDVIATYGLFESEPTFNPDWVYDPTAGPDEDFYAPTAAEMHPDMVPPEGWPPQDPEVQ